MHASRTSYLSMALGLLAALGPATANAKKPSQSKPATELAPPATSAAKPPAPGAAAAATNEENAKRFFAAGQYAEAIAEFEKAFRVSNDPAFLYNMALCHRLLGNSTQALVLYEGYLVRVPDGPYRAQVAARIQELKQILAAQERATPAPPVSTPPAPAPVVSQSEQNGKRLFEAGRFAEAAAEFEQAYRTSRDPALLYNTALCYRRAGNPAWALARYREYLTYVPDSPQRATVEAHIAELEQELREQQRPTPAPASNPAPAAPKVVSQSEQNGKRLFEAGQFAPAAAEFEQAYQATGDAALLYNMALCYRRAGNRQRALARYQEYLARVPDSPERATVAARIADLKREMSEQERAVQPPVANPAPVAAAPGSQNEQNGKRMFEAGQFALAAAEFEQAYQAGGDPALLYNMALCYRRAGNAPRALARYQEYLARVPDSPQRPTVEAHIAELRQGMAGGSAEGNQRAALAAVAVPPARPEVSAVSTTPLPTTSSPPDRRRFSGGRLVVEILASALVGSLAAYGTYSAICGSEACFGGAMAGLAANMVVTPLTAWGLGEAMGGDGSLSFTYSIGLMGFGVGSAASQNNPGLALAIGAALMPLLSPIAYEVSSHHKSNSTVVSSLTPGLAPLYTKGGGLAGAGATLVGAF